MTAVESVVTIIASNLTAIESTEDLYNENMMTAIVSKRLIYWLINDLDDYLSLAFLLKGSASLVIS
jgi:hypothetical protein